MWPLTTQKQAVSLIGIGMQRRQEDGDKDCCNSRRRNRAGDCG